MKSIFLQDLLFFFFKLIAEFFNLFMILLYSGLFFIMSQILFSLIIKSFSVILFLFTFVKIFPVINNHSINLLDLYIWLFFGQFFKSFFKIASISIRSFSLLGEKFEFFL